MRVGTHCMRPMQHAPDPNPNPSPNQIRSIEANAHPDYGGGFRKCVWLGLGLGLV